MRGVLNVPRRPRITWMRCGFNGRGVILRLRPAGQSPSAPRERLDYGLQKGVWPRRAGGTHPRRIPAPRTRSLLLNELYATARIDCQAPKVTTAS